MKLKKFIKQIDPIVDVIIWGSKHEYPLYEGAMFDIPKNITKYKIGRADGSSEEPIFIITEINKYQATLPIIVINVIED